MVATPIGKDGASAVWIAAKEKNIEQGTAAILFQGMVGKNAWGQWKMKLSARKSLAQVIKSSIKLFLLKGSFIDMT